MLASMALEVVADVEAIVHYKYQENGISLIFRNTASCNSELSIVEEWDNIVDVVGVHVVKVHNSNALCSTEPDYCVVFSHEVRISQICGTEGTPVLSLEDLHLFEIVPLQNHQIVSYRFLDHHVA
jgi:hypothetical protein